MIEYIITLTKPQSKRIVEIAEKAGYIDETLFIQEMVVELADNKDLATVFDEDKRLEHTEK